jgi:hypothetical protein
VVGWATKGGTVRSRLRRRPSPALIVAIAALIVALGGTAIAANTIRSSDIVDGQVMTPDLHRGAVVPAKISRIPAVGLVRNSNLSVNPNTPNLVRFDAENFDTADMHSGTGFLVEVPITGIYQATAHVSWVGTLSTTLPAGTECTIGLASGTPLESAAIGSSKGDCSKGHAMELNRAVKLPAHETLFMAISQDSDATFTLDAASIPVYLDVTWVAPPS